MRCKPSDCFTCPYPDCINDEEPRVWAPTPEQREEHNAKIRARRAERRASGLCTACGKRPPDDGYHSCMECRLRWRRDKAKENRKKGILPKHMMNGVDLCQKCGKAPPVEPYKLCERCLASNRAHLAKAPTHNHQRPVGWYNEVDELFWREMKGRKHEKTD